MKKIMFAMGLFMVVLLSVVIADVGRVYIVDLIVYKNDRVDLLDFKIQNGTPLYPTNGKDYVITIYSDKGSQLFSTIFDIGFDAWPDTVSSDGNMTQNPVSLDKVNLYLRLPYFENGKTIVLMHGNKVIFMKDIKGINIIEIMKQYWWVVVAISIFLLYLYKKRK